MVPTVLLAHGAQIGAFVAQFSASDSDSANGGQTLSYTLLGNNSGDFAISASGRVTVASALDPEVTPVYNLQVKVTDDGSPSRSNTTTFVVTVAVNSNLYAPEFGQPLYRKCCPPPPHPASLFVRC